MRCVFARKSKILHFKIKKQLSLFIIVLKLSARE